MKSREEREKRYFDNSMGSAGGSSTFMEEDVDDSELYDRVRCCLYIV